MTTISEKDRAEAQAMFEAFHGGSLAALTDNGVRQWLVVRDHVLAAHECPTVPVWRPTTAEEIQPGWEIRTRHRDDSPWVGWPTCGRRGRPMACTTPSTYSTASPPTKPDSPCTPNTSPTEKRRDPARCGHCGQTTEGA